MSKLLIKNIGRLQTPIGSYPHAGKAQGENLKLDEAAVFTEDGIIKAITGRTEDGKFRTETLGPDSKAIVTVTDEAPALVDEFDPWLVTLDAKGNLVTPGLVDGHTHMVFGGYRQNEIPLKLKGAGYLDILRAGGGINDTVKKTREATPEELYDKTKGFLDEMMDLGVTTCEAKSGYGIDLDTEVKLLEVLKKLNQEHPMDIVSTFMPAHVVLADWKGREDEFIDRCINEMFPYVKEHDLAEFVDIFTEDSVFNYEQSKRYLQAAKDLGFGLKIHADEIEAIGGSKLAGEIGATSAEHLIVINDEGLESMAKGETIAMCLPATSFYLGATFAPVRRMIDEFGIPVATEPSVRHESGLPEVQDDPGRGADGGDHQPGLWHRKRRQGGNSRGWKECRPGGLERPQHGDALLQIRLRSGHPDHQSRSTHETVSGHRFNERK